MLASGCLVDMTKSCVYCYCVIIPSDKLLVMPDIYGRSQPGCCTSEPETGVVHFAGGSPFRSPLFSSPGFLSVLCPLVKELELCLQSNPVTRDQFVAICHLSNLEVLDISVDSDDSGGEVCCPSHCGLAT